MGKKKGTERLNRLKEKRRQGVETANKLAGIRGLNYKTSPRTEEYKEVWNNAYLGDRQDALVEMCGYGLEHLAELDWDDLPSDVKASLTRGI